MKEVFLISCSNKKSTYETSAKNLYTSPLFKLSLDYARSRKPDKIFILSAKHKIVELDQKIRPYDETLSQLSSSKVKLWSNSVIEQLSGKVSLDKSHITFLTGKKYYQYLLHNIPHYSLPLEGLGIGKRLKFLKQAKNER